MIETYYTKGAFTPPSTGLITQFTDGSGESGEEENVYFFTTQNARTPDPDDQLLEMVWVDQSGEGRNAHLVFTDVNFPPAIIVGTDSGERDGYCHLVLVETVNKLNINL